MKISIILFFIFFAFSASAQIDEDKLVNEADSLIDVEKYNDALKLYNNLLANNPNNSTYLLRNGLCYFYLENYEKAKESFRLALLYEDPNNKENLALINSNLSACFSNLSEDEKAFEYAMKAYHIDETDLTLFNAASLSNNVDEFENALEILNKSKIEKHNGFNVVYGKSYLNLEEYEKSVEYYETFFDNYDESSNYADFIHYDLEKYNLLQAYLYLMKNNIDNELNKKLNNQRIIEISEEVSKTEKNENVKEIVLSMLIDKKVIESSYLDVYKDVFNTLQNIRPSENALFLYRTREYEKSLEVVNSILNDKGLFSDEEMTHARMLNYLIELNLMMAQTDKNSKTVDENQLAKVVALFSDYYKSLKKADYDVYQSEAEYYNPFIETFFVINVKSEYNSEKKKLVLSKLFETIPNEKVKNEMIESLKQF